jgi:hypothetical protein
MTRTIILQYALKANRLKFKQIIIHIILNYNALKNYYFRL